MRKLLTAAAMTAICAATSIAVAAPVHAATTACTGTVQITSFTFNPAQAAPGQTATATVVAQNCTGQPQQASVMITARFTGPSAGIPAGCPAIDPLPPQRVSFAPNGTATATQTYTIFSGCTATALEVTARFTDAAGALLATQTATLPIAAPATACAVTYRTSSQWPSGFVAQITVANTGTVAVTGWSLAFTYPGDQHITGAWNAVVHQSGAAVTAGNVRYNATIAPGASTAFGVTGSWRTSNAAPATFTLNGVACATR